MKLVENQLHTKRPKIRVHVCLLYTGKERHKCYLNTIQYHLSRSMTKLQNHLYAQRRLKSSWAEAQSDQGLHCPSEGSLGY